MWGVEVNLQRWLISSMSHFITPSVTEIVLWKFCHMHVNLKCDHATLTTIFCLLNLRLDIGNWFLSDNQCMKRDCNHLLIPRSLRPWVFISLPETLLYPIYSTSNHLKTNCMNKKPFDMWISFKGWGICFLQGLHEFNIQVDKYGFWWMVLEGVAWKLNQYFHLLVIRCCLLPSKLCVSVINLDW